MYKPAGLKNTEMKELNSKREIPKSIITFFFIIQVIFGLNFGFTKCLNKQLQTVAKIISLTISLIVFSIISVPVICQYLFYLQFHMWFYGVVFQYATLFIVLEFSKYKIYEFVQDISTIGDEIKELRFEFIGIVAFKYSLLIFLTGYVTGMLYCNDMGIEACRKNHIIPYYVYGPASLSVDLISSITLLIYYYIYCCVKKLKTTAMKTNLNLKEIEKFYLNLAKCYEKIRPFYDRLMMAELLFEIPKLMAMVYWMLRSIKTQEGWSMVFYYAVFSGHIFIRILIPSIMTEMVNHEVECTKRALNYKLLKEEDEKKCESIGVLVRYMEAARLEHSIWRVIPVDMRLPLSVLSLSATYLIVIVQYTHLYD